MSLKVEKNEVKPVKEVKTIKTVNKRGDDLPYKINHNGFVVVRIHYSLDPNKKDNAKWKEIAGKGISKRQWDREYELGYDNFAGLPVIANFSNEQVQKFDFNPKETNIIYRGWDFGYHHPACYDKKTKVLTKNGWKYFKDLEDNDKMATINTKTKEIEYQDIQAKIHYKFSGDMYSWNKKGNKQVNIRVTDNHLMLVDNKHFNRFDFVEARNMGINSHVPTVGEWKGKNFESPIEDISEKEFASFMGIWLSEGSLNSYKSRKTGKGKHYNIWVWQKKNEKKIGDILEKMPNKFKRYEKSIGWCGASKEIYNYLFQFGKAGDKYVPKEIKNSKKDVIISFLEMYEFGDGTTNQKGLCRKVTTKSKIMADDLQELYLKTGISSRVYKEERIVDGVLRTCYNVVKNGHYKQRAMKKDLIIEKVIDEDVYCVMVKNHTLFVRREEGRPIFCGNCVVAFINEHEQFCIRKTIMGENEKILDFGLRVKNYCNAMYQGAHFIDACDPAGNQVKDTTETSIEYLNSIGIYPLSRPSKIIEGLEIIRNLNDKRIDNKFGLIIHPDCTILIDAMLGGYRYKESREGQTVSEVPLKDGYYDHLCDSLRYLLINTDQTDIVRFMNKNNGLNSNPITRSGPNNYWDF